MTSDRVSTTARALTASIATRVHVPTKDSGDSANWVRALICIIQYVIYIDQSEYCDAHSLVTRGTCGKLTRLSSNH